MSSIGYASPSVHGSAGSPGIIDMDLFKITLVRRMDGSFHWSPEFGSQAWIDALNFEFPDDSTIEQKMRMAVARKVREEHEQRAMFSQPFPGVPNPPSMGGQQSSFSSGAPTLIGPAVSPLEQPVHQKTLSPSRIPNHRVKVPGSGAGRIQKPAKRMEDHITTFNTKDGGPITKGRKGPLTEKQREDAKKSRRNKSVCADHKKSRTKCDPEKCPKNALYTGPRTPSQPLVEGHSRTPSNASRYSQRSHKSAIVDNSSNRSFGTSNFPQTPTAISIGHSTPPSINTPIYSGNQHGVPYAAGMRYSNPGFINPTIVWQEQQYMVPPQIMSSAPSSNADPYNMGAYTYQPNNYQPMYSTMNPMMNPMMNQISDPMLNTASVKSLSQDETMFPRPDANDPVMGVPRQDSYTSHGSAHEYFTSDELPPVDPNAPLPELSPEVMRELERIQNEFGQGNTFRSLDTKRHPKKLRIFERIRRLIRRLPRSHIFQRKMPEDYGTSGTEWINVDMIEIVEGPKIAKRQKRKGRDVAKLQTVDEKQENDARLKSAARVEQWAKNTHPASMAAEMAKLSVNDASGKDTGKPIAQTTATNQEGKADEILEDQAALNTESPTTATSTEPATSASEVESASTDEEAQSTKSAANTANAAEKGEGKIGQENRDHVLSIADTTAETKPASDAVATVGNTEIESEVASPVTANETLSENPPSMKKEADPIEDVITLISAIQVQPTEPKTAGLVKVEELRAGEIGV